MITLTQILTPVTEDEALQWCLDQLTSLGFAATSWQETSRQRFVVQLLARMYSQFSNTIADIAGGGLNEYASAGWLTLLSSSHYDNDRFDPVTTQGTEQFTASSAFPGPQTYSPGQIVLADNVNGYTYRNTASFTLAASSTVSVPIEAEVAAANRDVPVNTITVMKTPIAGVSVNNPAVGSTGTWITRNGADAEADDALRTRNRSKWATLGIAPGMTYQYYAAKGHESVRRVFVDAQNPRGPGTVNVWIAGDSGALAPSVVNTVLGYLQGVPDGLNKIGTGADLQVLSALNSNVNVTGSLYILQQYNNAATLAKITAAVQAYFQSLPIGGVKTSGGGLGIVPFAGIIAAILPITGVQNVALSSPVGNVVLDVGNVAVPTITLTPYPV